MSRLIDADKLLENKFKNDISWTAFEKLIKRQPTVDAVEVVRCKDCKYWYDNKPGRILGKCAYIKQVTPEFTFCGYGKRKVKA